jgi:hypothetical protein
MSGTKFCKPGKKNYSNLNWYELPIRGHFTDISTSLAQGLTTKCSAKNMGSLSRKLTPLSSDPTRQLMYFVPLKQSKHSFGIPTCNIKELSVSLNVHNCEQGH